MPPLRVSWAAIALLFVAACSRDKAPQTGRARTDSPALPALQIIAPQSGARWEEGTSQIVRWHASVPGINLGVAVGGKDKGHLLLNAPATPDSLVWEIPVGFVTGFGLDSATDVRFRLENAADPTEFVVSGAFTIIGRAGS